jgi:hypothetical protein
MEFILEQKNDLLTNAAYTIAVNDFEYVKWPMAQGPHHREKTLKNIVSDTRYMFTGSKAPRNPEIMQFVDDFKIRDARLPIDMHEARSQIEEWINRSSRVKLINFSCMKHFNYVNGCSYSMDSFANRAELLYVPKKSYHLHRYHQSRLSKLRDIFSNDIKPGSHVILEIPTLYYDNKDMLNAIEMARQKDCRIALDLTWLPISTYNITIDLNHVDEIYFSMNKTWPIDDIRPSFRWSKERIEDSATFEHEICIYPKLPPKLFIDLTKRFEFDFVYDNYKKTVEDLLETFDLKQSPVLWFTKHKSVYHDHDKPLFPGYFMDEFVCLRKLLEHHGKYFW